MPEEKNERETEKDQGVKTHDATDPLPGNDQKVFCSRISAFFTEETIKRLFEERLGEGTVLNVSLVYEKKDDESDKKGNKEASGDDEVDRFGRPKKKKSKKDTSDEDGKRDDANEEEQQHLGYGFVTFETADLASKAASLGTVRGKAKPNSHRKYTFYVRPCLDEENPDDEGQKVCFLWQQHRCPYGDKCKFEHKGEGGLLKVDTVAKNKKKKCRDYRKGKCKLSAEECPFSHDFEPKQKNIDEKLSKRTDSEKDCISWKSKGKCRKGNSCPYKHDPELQKAALAKKEKKRKLQEKDSSKNKKQKRKENRRPISVRVFGLNYDTTEQDVRNFLQDCGPITRVEFPKFSDSGRSKGYCGVWFQSPVATDKAVALDGKELQGRWLRIQAGKMLLDEWEKKSA